MFLEELINDIESAGIAVFGDTMYASDYPVDAGDECILVRSNMPPAPLKDIPVEFHMIQILSRAIKYQDAHSKAMEVYKRYHADGSTGSWLAVNNYSVGSRYVYNSEALQMPFDISPDGKGRSEVSFNIVFKVLSE